MIGEGEVTVVNFFAIIGRANCIFDFFEADSEVRIEFGSYIKNIAIIICEENNLSVKQISKLPEDIKLGNRSKDLLKELDDWLTEFLHVALSKN